MTTSAFHSSTYLETVKRTWSKTIELAKAGGANAIQLEALEDLSISEFGYSSNNRLKYMWQFSMDRDGDVILKFRAPFEIDKLTGNFNQHAAAVDIIIDHAGIITHVNLESNDQVVYNPRGAMNNTEPPVWIFDNKFIKPFTKSAISVFRLEGLNTEGLWCEDTNSPFVPFIKEVMLLEFLSETEAVGRMYGELLFLKEVHRDLVDGSRIYSCHRLSRLQKLRLHTCQLLDRPVDTKGFDSHFRCYTMVSEFWSKLRE